MKGISAVGSWYHGTAHINALPFCCWFGFQTHSDRVRASPCGPQQRFRGSATSWVVVAELQCIFTMLLFYRCLTNYHKRNSSKQHPVSWLTGLESGCHLAGCSALGLTGLKSKFQWHRVSLRDQYPVTRWLLWEFVLVGLRPLFSYQLLSRDLVQLLKPATIQEWPLQISVCFLPAPGKEPTLFHSRQSLLQHRIKRLWGLKRYHTSPRT